MSPSLRAFGARARRHAVRTFLLAGAVVTGTGLLAAACGGTAASPASAPHAAARAPLSGQVALGSSDNAAAVPAPSAKGSARVNGRLTRIVLPTQSIIYTAILRLRVDDVAGEATKAAMIVTDAGGYVAGEHETIPQNKHNAAVAYVQVKIPVAAYRTTLATLRATLGTQLSFSQQAQDVTQQVANVNSRVTSAQAAIAQLRALLKRAGSVGQLLSVQEQINYQESNLEALLAQQRALAHETSYATVSVVLYGHRAKIVKKHHKTSPGFAGGLRGGWHALGLVVSWLLTALGSVLPFAAVVALIGGLVYASRRRLARRKAPPAGSPPAADAP